MKHFFMTLVTLLAFASFSHAEETVGEKVDQGIEDTTEKAKEMGSKAKVESKKAARKAKRTAKKGMHRAQEAVCMEGDVECAAKKAKHRMEEGKDSAVDTMKDTQDQMSK
ncbi:hypothetical protein [Bdellovibrio bacteriovorus]|uniref:hypothetical protein n=1 Tax=Bdellovibrio TaxID=958 RepID=UPI0035A96505